MAKQMVSIRLEEEVRDTLKELSRRSDDWFGAHISQAQVVELAIGQLARQVAQVKEK